MFTMIDVECSSWSYAKYKSDYRVHKIYSRGHLITQSEWKLQQILHDMLKLLCLLHKKSCQNMHLNSEHLRSASFQGLIRFVPACSLTWPLHGMGRRNLTTYIPCKLWPGNQGIGHTRQVWCKLYPHPIDLLTWTKNMRPNYLFEQKQKWNLSFVY